METIIKVSRSELMNKLRVAGRMIQAGKALGPSASWFRVKADGTGLVVTATDMAGAMSVKVSCIEVINGCEFCVEAKPLMAILDTLTEQPLVFTVNEKKLKGVYLGGKFEMPVEDVSAFQDMPVEKEYKELTIDRRMFTEHLRAVMDCAGNDELRPTMSCVFVEAKDGRLTFVATDAHKLSMRESATDAADVDVMIPVRAAKLLTQLLPLCDEKILMRITRQRIWFESGEYTFVYRLPEGRYPNFWAVIPNNRSVVEVDAAELSAAVRRVSVFADSEHGVMKMTIGNNAIAITSENRENVTSAREELSVACDFELVVGLKTSFMLQLLGSVRGACRLLFSTATRAVVIKSKDDEGVLMLLMPMMVE